MFIMTIMMIMNDVRNDDNDGWMMMFIMKIMMMMIDVRNDYNDGWMMMFIMMMMMLMSYIAFHHPNNCFVSLCNINII